MSSIHGCPVQKDDLLWHFYDENTIFVGLMLTFLGFFLIALSGLFAKYAFQLMVTLVLGLTTTIVLLKYGCPPFMPAATVWLALYISLGIGAFVSYGAAKWPGVGSMVSAAFLGTFFGELIYCIVLTRLVADPKFSEYISILTCFGIIAICSFRFYIYASLLCNAIIGSYCFFRVSRY